MVKEMAKNIYRIEVPMPDNPLRILNSYFIRGEEREILIDTGFQLPECREALAAGLAELGSEQDRRDILLTHLHSDHSGLAAEFVGEKRHIYMNATDLDYQRGICEGDIYLRMHEYYLAEGYPPELVAEHEYNNPARQGAMKTVDPRFAAIHDGQHFHVGEYDLKAIDVPGHTPGNTMFYIEKQKIMFTGDHILFDITPNITAFVGIEDSLGKYLDSLKKSAAYEVDLALPGHREHGDYNKRIEEIQAHHAARIAEAEKLVIEEPGLTAYEITGQMKWKIHSKDWASFPNHQKWFAVGECMAHLDYLRLQGRIVRKQDEKGIWHYFQS